MKGGDKGAYLSRDVCSEADSMKARSTVLWRDNGRGCLGVAGGFSRAPVLERLSHGF